jgi:hypothetical protein
VSSIVRFSGLWSVPFGSISMVLPEAPSNACVLGTQQADSSMGGLLGQPRNG